MNDRVGMKQTREPKHPEVNNVVRKGRAVLLITLLVGGMGTSHAITYPFPVVTSVEYVETSEYGTEVYKANVKPVYVSDPRIPEGATVTEALEILSGQKPDATWVAGHTVSGGRYANGLESWETYDMKGKNQKFLEFMEQWTDVAISNGERGRPWREVGSRDAFCVTNRVKVVSAGDTWLTSFYFASWGVDSYDSCTRSRPPTGYCQLKTATVNFDYGTISSVEADGAALEKPVTVHCTTKIKYNLQVQGGPEIVLDNGMAATIMTDGELAGETLNGSSGDNTVTLRATLRGKPSRTGAFAGSGIMVVSYP